LQVEPGSLNYVDPTVGSHCNQKQPTFATDLTPLWAALGGGIVVGATTIIAQVFSNRAVQTQSHDQRRHEMVLDERRAVRSTRQEVYPKVTGAVREILTFFQSGSGTSDERIRSFGIPVDRLSERNAIWAEVTVLGSAEVYNLLMNFVSEANELHRVSVELIHGLDQQQKGSENTDVPAKMAELQSRVLGMGLSATALFSQMRDEIGPPSVSPPP
jgi:hypothetical protein